MHTSSPELLAEDVGFMERALALAREAGRLGEVPVGALCVAEGKIVGEGFNRREVDKDPFAHAEMRALAEAARTLGRWRLTGVTVYVTLEPCAMCAGAMVQGRVSRLVLGATDPKAGAVGSLYNLVEEPRHNHRVLVARGVLEDACGAMLTDFFRALRAGRKD